MNPNANLFTPARSLLLILLTTGLVLTVPLIAMQFSEDMNWNTFDFAALAVVVLGAATVFTLAASRVRDLSHRTAIGFLVAIVLALVIVELGVGFLGSPIAGS